MFKVQKNHCASCIYLPSSPFDLAALEAEIADPHLEGFFTGYRVCHHSEGPDGVCCAEFWKRHKDHFTAGQLAQRLGLIKRVVIDVLKKGSLD